MPENVLWRVQCGHCHHQQHRCHCRPHQCATLHPHTTAEGCDTSLVWHCQSVWMLQPAYKHDRTAIASSHALHSALLLYTKFAAADEIFADADGMSLPLLFPAGMLTVAPGLTPSTAFNVATGKWDTKQAVAVGAVNLTTISLITATVATLPPSIGVRRRSHLLSYEATAPRAHKPQRRLPPLYVSFVCAEQPVCMRV